MADVEIVVLGNYKGVFRYIVEQRFARIFFTNLTEQLLERLERLCELFSLWVWKECTVIVFLY